MSVRGFLKSYLLEYRRILAFQLDFLELLREVGANGASPAVWWLFTVQRDRIMTTNVLAQGSSPLPLPWLWHGSRLTGWHGPAAPEMNVAGS